MRGPDDASPHRPRAPESAPMRYLIGDLQGCCDALLRLLQLVDFSPSRDQLVVLGDLVNRGPDSLGTLRALARHGDAVTALLGNHDLHALAVSQGLRRPHRQDTLQVLLDAPDAAAWIDWLRQRPLAWQGEGWLGVHAGLPPAWDAARALEEAAAVQACLRGPDWRDFLAVMYGNQPERWDPALQGTARLRFAVNALTRTRFVEAATGRLDFAVKEGAAAAPPGLLPWFEVPGRASAGTPIAFGHWSMLGLIDRPDLLALDTGCVWGGRLTAARIDGGRREILQVDCPQAQRPG